MSVHFWGESVVPESGEGKWILSVMNGGDRPAVLNDFQITFYGTQTDPQPGLPLNTAVVPQEEPSEKEAEVLLTHEPEGVFDFTTIVDNSGNDDKEPVITTFKPEIIPEEVLPTIEQDAAFPDLSQQQEPTASKMDPWK